MSTKSFLSANSGSAVSLPNDRNSLQTEPFNRFEGLSKTTVTQQQAQTSTVMEMRQYSQGWVDKARILTNDEFIQKLKDNLK